MKKSVVILALLVLLPVLPAGADTFRMGGTYNVLEISYNGSPAVWNGAVGGGSYDVSQLNGANLAWVFCVDLEHTINLNTTYNNATVKTNGTVNGQPVNNAGQVAWLVNEYAATAAGNSVLEAALQGAIWEAIYGTSFALTNTTAAYFAPSVSMFNASVGHAADTSTLLWLTPAATNSVQGLVTRVPEPGSMLLLGVGLFGLAWAARRRRHGV